VGFARELQPTTATGECHQPLFHQPPVPRVEELAFALFHQLVGASAGQAYDELAVYRQHRKDLTTQLQRAAAEPLAAVRDCWLIGEGQHDVGELRLRSRGHGCGLRRGEHLLLQPGRDGATAALGLMRAMPHHALFERCSPRERVLLVPFDVHRQKPGPFMSGCPELLDVSQCHRFMRI
jgi:hypothetical protein